MGNRELERKRRAVEQTRADHPRRAERMRTLGRVWRQHALAAGDTAELDRAIGYFRGELSQPGTALAAAGYNLALLLSDRYDALGVTSDLEEAIGAIQDALADLPAGAAAGTITSPCGDCACGNGTKPPARSPTCSARSTRERKQ